MRILQVIHQFPPHSSQGSELHCQQLSRYFRDHGDAVGVFHLSNFKPRHPKRLLQYDQDGLNIFHCIDGGQYSRQADWPNFYLRKSFSRALDIFQPDLVHFHHYLSLGDGLVRLAKTKTRGIVYTLHDFGLLCPNEHLLRDQGGLCEKATPDFFEACCPTRIRSNRGVRPGIIAQLPPLERWREFAAHQSGSCRRALMQATVKVAEKILGRPESRRFEDKKSFFLSSTRQIIHDVDQFLAPSNFLLERFIACGIPQDKIIHLRYGMTHFPVKSPAESHDKKLRFGYIGAFHPHKGIDLLLSAFQGLGAHASLHLHGSSFASPVSEAYLQQITSQSMKGVVLHGPYDNREIGDILSSLDAIIVPSRWYENSPLTIQEAQIARVPVITAGVGGMAELVRDGIDGLHFRCNDAIDLHRVLRSLIDSPAQLHKLRTHIPKVPTVEEQAHQVRQLYQDLFSQQGAP
ncbi:MAG: glycosyltransferase [Cyanobacteriota bacterium]|nr:glycosyltransferase [Cyanobacteriota bacterium]